MAKIVIVKFTKPYPPYRPGDVAGFEAREAKKLTEGFTREEGGRRVKYGPWAKKVKETTTEKLHAQRQEELRRERAMKLAEDEALREEARKLASKK